MKSFRGQASLAKMTSPGGNVTAQACCPTKKVHKAKELTYLSNTAKKPLKSRTLDRKLAHFLCFENKKIYKTH
jgi:hypothetical protein